MTTTTTTRETTSGRRSISDRRREGPSIDLDDRSIDRRPRRDGNEGTKDGSAFEFISFRFDSFVRLSVRPCLRARERCDDDGVDEIDRVVFRARERGRGLPIDPRAALATSATIDSWVVARVSRARRARGGVVRARDRCARFVFIA